MQRTSAATRLIALLGHPVAHSVSPQIHAAALAATGFDASYLAFDVLPERLAAAVTGLAALGAVGANVTIPHKASALALADVRTAEADAIGAANTLVFTADGVLADNTDAAGLGVVLQQDIGLANGEVVVLLGAGGAARAVAVALGRAGAAVHVEARRPEAAAEVAALAVAHGGALAGGGEAPRMVVNATPLGLHGEALPQPYMRLGPGQVALDLLYGREPTPFLQAASSHGAAAVDGLGMLVAQAAASFERWTGLSPPVDRMRAAAEQALGRRSGTVLNFKRSSTDTQE